MFASIPLAPTFPGKFAKITDWETLQNQVGSHQVRWTPTNRHSSLTLETCFQGGDGGFHRFYTGFSGFLGFGRRGFIKRVGQLDHLRGSGFCLLLFICGNFAGQGFDQITDCMAVVVGLSQILGFDNGGELGLLIADFFQMPSSVAGILMKWLWPCAGACWGAMTTKVTRLMARNSIFFHNSVLCVFVVFECLYWLRIAGDYSVGSSGAPSGATSRSVSRAWWIS